MLVGQTILGWHNDLVDRERDEDHHAPRKPIAEGRLDAGTAWFALTIAVLLVIPLSISTGVTAGTLYLLSLVLGILGNVVLRRGVLSWVTWAASSRSTRPTSPTAAGAAAPRATRPRSR